MAGGGSSTLLVRGFDFSCSVDGDLDPAQTILLSKSLKGSCSLVNLIAFALASVSGSSSTSMAAFPLPLKTDFWRCQT